jgi:hypothetical protein
MAKQLGKEHRVGTAQVDRPGVLAKDLLDMHKVLKLGRNADRDIDPDFMHSRLGNSRHFHRHSRTATTHH